ncbi:hypothetical protein L1987_28321 [Smallanthus sonchifolius]|uniref:Uncharacterized protein n=1 Tax=Smallanthus sonchifolius TaxID=185202 RepID=A0ACB9IDZ9_9ASTR|nr:hypothetical protein L1987_28321 [Smallanthus sonchifolius]
MKHNLLFNPESTLTSQDVLLNELTVANSAHHCKQDKPGVRDDDNEDLDGIQGGGEHQIASITPCVTHLAESGESKAQGESGAGDSGKDKGKHVVEFEKGAEEVHYKTAEGFEFDN